MVDTTSLIIDTQPMRMLTIMTQQGAAGCLRRRELMQLVLDLVSRTTTCQQSLSRLPPSALSAGLLISTADGY